MAQLQRFKPIFQGRYKKWSELNLAAMQDIEALLPTSTRVSVKKFEEMRTSDSCGHRIIKFLQSGIRRQSLASNATLLMALIFKLA